MPSHRVVRLLAVLEVGPSPIAIGSSLQATFACQQERGAVQTMRETVSGPALSPVEGTNGIPQVAVESLPIEKPSKGPALVVLPGASAFVPKGMPYHVDEWGNLILSECCG